MKKRQRRQVTKTIWKLRAEALRPQIVRLLFLGWSAEKIARTLHCNPQTVRDAINTVELQHDFAAYQRDQLKHLDQQVAHLLHAAVRALGRLLKDPDWRARDAAVRTILRMHGRYVERLAITGTLAHQHTGTPEGMIPPMDDMTDEQRDLTRKLLASLRPPKGNDRLTRSHEEPRS